MFSPAESRLRSAARLEISRIDSPSVDFYRRLYREVGSTYLWVDRLVMPDEQLQAIIQDDRVDVFVLTVAEQPAGYSSLTVASRARSN